MSALDAVEQGINRVELDDAEQYYVGVGGLPNALGVVECDAAVMDHRRRYGERHMYIHTPSLSSFISPLWGWWSVMLP